MSEQGTSATHFRHPQTVSPFFSFFSFLSESDGTLDQSSIEAIFDQFVG